jgi:hypothetical protein
MTTADVIAALASARPLDEGSAPWTRRFLETAERQFGRRWHRVELTGEDALAIVLPPHAGEPCRGDRLQLVDAGGASVRAAAARLRKLREDYARANSTCWSRISGAASAPFSELILTPAPLDSDDHRALPIIPGALYHLDGFHRLLGWAIADRLTPETRLAAIVAGERRPRVRRSSHVRGGQR